MTNKKVSTKQERSDLKKIAKISSKANKRPAKTDEEVVKEFEHLANERFKVAVKDFQERWENNNVKVGNFLTRNAELLQQDLQNFINEKTKIDKINQYYNKFVYKYGLEELIEELFECVVKNISTDELNEVITLVEVDINKAIEATSTVVDGVVGFTEGSVGAVEAIYDATSAIRKNVIDYKATRVKEKVKGKSKVDKQRYLKQINDILVPLITRHAANVLRTVVETQCDDVPGEISIVVDESVGILSKELADIYGIDQDSVDDYVRLLNDVSGFVTPIEICKLFKGQAEESLINSIFYFVALNYTGIHESNLYSKQRLIAFFILVGKIVNAEDKYCKEIERNSLYSGFCFQEDSYAAKLRECLEKKESKEKIKVTFKELQKEKVRRALSVLALPTEMNNGIRSLNQSGIIDAEKQIRRKALLSSAEKRKLEYDRTVNMYGDYYNVYAQRTKKVDQIVDDAFNKIPNVDEKTKKQIEQYTSSFGDIGYNITEKFIMPGLFENLVDIRSNDFKTRDLRDLSGSLFLKLYTTGEFSKRQLSNSFGSFNKVDSNYLGLAIDEEKAIYNEMFSHPSVHGQYISFNIDTKEAKHSFETKLSKGSHYISSLSPNKYDLVDIVKGESKYNYKEEDLNLNFSGTTFKDLRSRYLDIVKIGYQSPFSRKIPVGIVDGVSDNGYISGLEALKLSPQIPADCVDVIRERFSLIDFPKLAVELADYPFEDRGGELDDLKKNNPTFAKVFRENYFQTLSDFKSFILDFCLKNIFFLSQFNLNYEDVSEVLADYLYEQYFHFLREDEKAIDYNLDLFGYSNLADKLSINGRSKYFKKNVKEYFEDKSQIANRLREELQKGGSRPRKVLLKDLSKRADEFASNFNYNYLYDVTNFLNHYYNNFVTSDGDKDFCFSIKELIKLEIENISLGVKDLIYDKNQIAAKNFDLEGRVIEEQFNLYLDDKPTSEVEFLKNSLKDILNNKIVTHRYNNFYETGPALDQKVRLGDIGRSVEMQLGEDGFYTTRILKEEQEVFVEVYHSVYKPKFPKGYKTFEINEEDFIQRKEILGAGSPFLVSYMQIVEKPIRGDDDKKEIDKFFGVGGGKLNYEKALEIVLFESDYNNKGAKDPKIKQKFDGKELTFEESLKKIFDGGVAGIFKREDDEFIRKVLDRLKQAKNVVSNSKKASFIKNPFKIGGVRWEILGRPDYPFSNVYNFFKEGDDRRSFQIYNYQRKGTDKENIKRFRQITLTDEVSGFGDFVRGKQIKYKLVKSFSVPIDNYDSFQKNFEKEYGYEPGFREYYEFCAKKEVLNRLKSEMSLEDYKRRHYLKELLAMAMIQSSNLSEAIDLYRKQTGEKVSNKKVLFSSKKTFSLSELGIPGLDLQQQLNFSNVANFALPILTSGLQTFMTLAEGQSPNLKFSANTARIVNNAVLGAYIRGASAIDSLDRMFEFFGSDLVGGKGQGVPSPAELQEKNKALFVLFNIPVTAFSVPFWASGYIPVINIPLWIGYVISEAILYTLRIVGDQEVLEQIRKLFYGDQKRVDEFVDVKNRILSECEKIREEYLKRNPIVETGQTTGEKFLLPDGQEYYGNYHIHQDGTVMVGKNHETIKENIILTEIVSDEEG